VVGTVSGLVGGDSHPFWAWVHSGPLQAAQALPPSLERTSTDTRQGGWGVPKLSLASVGSPPCTQTRKP
jgi:hypothetical protein